MKLIHVLEGNKKHPLSHHPDITTINLLTCEALKEAFCPGSPAPNVNTGIISYLVAYTAFFHLTLHCGQQIVFRNMTFHSYTGLKTRDLLSFI